MKKNKKRFSWRMELFNCSKYVNFILYQALICLKAYRKQADGACGSRKNEIIWNLSNVKVYSSL